jgi:uncharacterized protein involved in type VI secretion and phage assembly
MSLSQLLEPPMATLLSGAYLAVVIDVNDPDSLSRVKVRLLSYDGVGDQDGPLWARVACGSAGSNRCAFLIPDVDDEVLVVFANGDARIPIVIGGLWNGSAAPPEQLGGAGDRVDRWTIKGKAGTRIAVVEEQGGQEKILFETPSGVTGELTDASGGKIEFKTSTSTITLDTQGVTVETSGKVKVQASQVDVTAGQVNVNSAISKFSGIVKCDVLQTNTVMSTTYTPGAGNVW